VTLWDYHNGVTSCLKVRKSRIAGFISFSKPSEVGGALRFTFQKQAFFLSFLCFYSIFLDFLRIFDNTLDILCYIRKLVTEVQHQRKHLSSKREMNPRELVGYLKHPRSNHVEVLLLVFLLDVRVRVMKIVI